MTLSAEPGLETKEYNVFDQCVHLAALSDIITAAVRKPSERPWLIPEDVTMVKAAGDDKCLIYFVGQSALEGFTLPYAASEVAEVIEDSFCDDEDEDVEDEPNEE